MRERSQAEISGSKSVTVDGLRNWGLVQSDHSCRGSPGTLAHATFNDSNLCLFVHLRLEIGIESYNVYNCYALDVLVVSCASFGS
jgi:hypothetical protein